MVWWMKQRTYLQSGWPKVSDDRLTRATDGSQYWNPRCEPWKEGVVEGWREGWMKYGSACGAKTKSDRRRGREKTWRKSLSKIKRRMMKGGGGCTVEERKQATTWWWYLLEGGRQWWIPMKEGADGWMKRRKYLRNGRPDPDDDVTMLIGRWKSASRIKSVGTEGGGPHRRRKW